MTGPAPDPDGLVISIRDTPTATVVAVRGELSLRTVPQLRRAVEKQLADRGRVLVDVSGLAVTWHPAIDAFPTALAAMTGWPAARLVLFGPGPATAELLAARPRLAASVHVAADEAEAVALLDVRPRRLSRRAELPCAEQAPKWARLLVEAVYEDWAVSDVASHAALMVVSELATNAVQHARTSSLLTLTLDERGLRIAVRDYLPGDGPSPGDGIGMGMALVAAVSRNWGVTPHDDGKTVWAVLARGAVDPSWAQLPEHR